MSVRVTPVLVALSLAAACGGAAPTTTEPKGAGTVAIAPPVKADGDVDMSPVAAPKTLLVVVRATSLKKTLEAVERLVPLPAKLDALLKEATKGASAYFDLGESFDLAVALDPTMRDLDDPKVFFGFTIPLSQDFRGLLDLIEKEGDEVRGAGPGVWRIRGKGADSLSCELLAAGGRAPRLVCADGTSSYREMGPWLARTLPTLPKPREDLWVRVDAAPVRDLFLPKLRRELDEGVGEARGAMQKFGVSDRELLDAPSVAARELTLAIEELDKLEGGLRIDAAKPEIGLSFELGFRGNQAWFTKVMTAQNGKPTRPPEVFWRLPKDSDSAFFGQSSDPALFTGIRRVAKKGLATALDLAGLEKLLENLADADKQAFVALVDAIPVTSGPWVYASGTLPPRPGGAAKAAGFTPQQAIVEIKNKARGILNWAVVATEGDPAQMVAFLNKSADAYARVIRMMKQEADEKLKNATGEMKKWRQEARRELDDAPKVRVVQNPAGYPKGSAMLEVDVIVSSDDVWTLVHPEKDWDKRPEHPKGKAVKGTVPFRFAVVPDEGKRYFWGYSADADVLKEKILASLKGAPADKTLATRKDLERMKKPMVAGGFASYGKMIESFARIDENDRDMREVIEIIGKLPNRGASPVFFTIGGKTGATPSVSIEMLLDKAWITDIAALVKEPSKR